MVIVHVSAECYPMAKAGGLGDVVGALPKYQAKVGDDAMVVMPMYQTPFLQQNKWEVHFKGSANLGNWFFDYTIIKESPGKFRSTINALKFSSSSILAKTVKTSAKPPLVIHIFCPLMM